jgi:uncharacterized protein YndB with AHSA1/START domain
MKLLQLSPVAACLAFCCATLPLPSRADEGPAAQSGSGSADADRTLSKLSQLVGGTWLNAEPGFVVEFRYEWAFGKTAVRGLGVIDKGGRHERQVEAILGLDPVTKTVYYLDCHGGDRVFTGTVKLEGDTLAFDFTTLVGPPARWREIASFPGKDSLQFTVYGEKEGKWVPVVQQTWKRQQPKGEINSLVTEARIDAPVAAVWAALTTKEGQESWNVAHAEIELKIGGRMRTHYDPKGTIGDPQTIENTILSFEPKRMLAFRVTHPPVNFPFKEAIQKMWTVIYFEEIAQDRTRVRVVGVGYGDDDESTKLRVFFDKGNAYTLEKLQKKFAGTAQKSASTKDPRGSGPD